LIAIAITLGGCGTEHISPPKPDVVDSKGFDIPSLKASTFSVPIDVTLADAQAACNDHAPAHLHMSQPVSVPGFVHEHIDVDVNRGPIQLKGAPGDRVSFLVPLSGQAVFHGNPHIGPLHTGVDVHETVNFDGHVDGTIGLAIQPDWSINADATPTLSLSRADVRFVNLITISVKGKVQDAFNHTAPDAARAALKAILDSLRLRSRAEAAWRTMHIRQQLAKAPDVWIEIQPTEVRVKPIVVRDGKVTLGLGLTASTHAFVDKDPPDTTSSPLPPLVIDPNLTNHFEIILPVQASFSELTAQLSDVLKGQHFEAEGVTLTVASIELYSSADRLVLGLNFTATHGGLGRSADGILYAHGSLAYDHGGGLLTVRDLDYDVETRSVLLKLADWLLKPRILQAVMEKAKMDVKPFLATAQDDANKYLAAIHPPSGISLTLNSATVALDDVRIAKGKLFLLLRSEGTTNIAVNPTAIH
jgi:hypothetical protein